MRLLLVPAALLALGTSCDGKLDEVRIKHATGIIGGWDRSVCTCGMTVDYNGTVNASISCMPLFAAKDAYDGTLQIPETAYNVPQRQGVWSYEGVNGAAIVEFTSSTTVDEHTGRGYRAVFIDALYLPEQDACDIFNDCTHVGAGSLEGMAAWCEDPRVVGQEMY